MKARDVIAGELDGAKADRLVHADGIMLALADAGWAVVRLGGVAEAAVRGPSVGPVPLEVGGEVPTELVDTQGAASNEALEQDLVAEGEPPPGSVAADPGVGVWVRDYDPPGLWRGQVAAGNVQVTAATWAQLCELVGGPLTVVSTPTVRTGPTVTRPAGMLELPMTVVEEVDGVQVRRTVTETVEIMEVEPG